jgi:hypothetical protein
MLQNLVLVDALFLLDGGRRRGGKRKKKKERETTIEEEGSPGLDVPCWLCQRWQLLGTIKG